MAGPDRAPAQPARAAGRKARGSSADSARNPAPGAIDARRGVGLERTGATGHGPDVQAERQVTVPPRARKG